MTSLVVLVASLSAVHLSACQDDADVTRLDEHIKNQVKVLHSRPPSNVSAPITVNVAFHLTSINDLDAASNTLKSNGWLLVTWRDDRVAWDPTAYGGVTSVVPDPNLLWRPPLGMRNTMKDPKPLGHDYYLLQALYNGTVQWFQAGTFETFCNVDVTYFPFDKQKCQWQMFIWPRGGGNIDLQLDRPEIDLDFYVGESKWKVRSTLAKRTTNGQFPLLIYEATLSRRATLLSVTIVLPTFLLAFINVFIFKIPCKAGERLSYSVTILLSYGVFMGYVINSLPSSWKVMSIVVIDNTILLTLSAVYVLLSILSTRLFYRDHNQPMPRPLQRLVLWLERLVCLNPPDVRDSQVTSSSDQQSPAGDIDGFGGKERWQRVSHALDRLCFRVFFLLFVILSIVTLYVVMKGK